MGNVILETVNLSKYFGGIRALEDVNIIVKEGRIVGIIGPNGAGKTTLFKCIAGYHKPSKGKIIYQGREIQGMPPHGIVKLGISMTFQVPRPFKGLSVRDNIVAALGSRMYDGLRFMREWYKEEMLNKAEYIARLVGLEDYLDTDAGLLPLGLQKRLELAKALATNPRLLLLDEPAAGMSREEALDLKEIIVDVKKTVKLTIMVVEHNVPFAVDLSDEMYVLNYGVVLAHGDPQEVIRDRRVVEAYLGRGYISG
ncbi:MAG: ABC transporter ATP-binding protein [Desulfurococcales archaeon]|nr:ABC transporter ATP-binding protein [Desulfurococcales archaeon]